MRWLRLALPVALLVALAACAPTVPSVTITWSTGSELDTAGFLIERSELADGLFENISQLLPTHDDPLAGGRYEFVDHNVQPGKMYYYRLITITNDNILVESGRISATAH